jgi:hypothetical protein
LSIAKSVASSKQKTQLRTWMRILGFEGRVPGPRHA